MNGKVFFAIIPAMLIGALLLFAIQHSGGTKISCFETPYQIPNGQFHRSQQMWGFSSNEIYIPSLPTSGSDGFVYKFNGNSVTQFFHATNDHFIATWGANNDNIWAVGASIVDNVGGAYLIDNDGNGIRHNIELGINSVYNSLRGSGANDILAAGNAGQIRRWDGNSWNLITSGTTNNLEKVFVLDSTHAYFGGASGTVLFWDGNGITNLNFPDATKRVSAIWGTSPTNIWFGTTPTPGAWWHYDGISFTEFQSNAPGLFTMHGLNANDIYSDGNLVVEHFDGANWQVIRDYTGYAPFGTTLTGLTSIWTDTHNLYFSTLNPTAPSASNSNVLVKYQCFEEQFAEIVVIMALVSVLVAGMGAYLYAKN